MRDLASDAREVRVDLGPRSYSVWIGEGLLVRLDELVPRGSWRKAAVLTDSNVGPLYAEPALGALRAKGLETVLLEIPAGEGSKTAEGAVEVVDWLIDSGLTRSDLLVALGGGVVGDLAGFASSIFKRGTALVQVPTTLMAQVDSAIGGKTAVNLPAAKNLLGTFHQPIAVVCDIDALATLDARDFSSGLAEVAKYSLITDEAWGRDFRAEALQVAAWSPARLAALVADCAGEKARLVSADECDTGVRHYLNYGHTLGHALEAASGYDGSYYHGESVSVGMVFAALVAERSGVAGEGLAGRHIDLLKALRLPVSPVGEVPSFDDLEAFMRRDKKSAGDLVMVLLEREGRPVVRRGLDPGLLEDCYSRLVSKAPGTPRMEVT
jgi:3-dehydroquinate synthase